MTPSARAVAAFLTRAAQLEKTHLAPVAQPCAPSAATCVSPVAQPATRKRAAAERAAVVARSTSRKVQS